MMSDRAHFGESFFDFGNLDFHVDVDIAEGGEGLHEAPGVAFLDILEMEIAEHFQIGAAVVGQIVGQTDAGGEEGVVFAEIRAGRVVMIEDGGDEAVSKLPFAADEGGNVLMAEAEDVALDLLKSYLFCGDFGDDVGVGIGEKFLDEEFPDIVDESCDIFHAGVIGTGGVKLFREACDEDAVKPEEVPVGVDLEFLQGGVDRMGHDDLFKSLDADAAYGVPDAFHVASAEDGAA